MFFSKKLLVFGATVSSILLGLVLLGASLPDRTLEMERVVYSKELPETIAATIDQVEDWPEWHFQLEKSRIIGPSPLVVGSRIEWILKPREWKIAVWELEVKEYVPGRKVRLAFVRDEPAKLDRTLQQLEWSIERLPETPDHQVPIRGYVTVRTRGARSRLLALVAEKIILNQVFYPDLTKFQFDLSATHHHPAFDPPPDSR